MITWTNFRSSFVKFFIFLECNIKNAPKCFCKLIILKTINDSTVCKLRNFFLEFIHSCKLISSSSNKQYKWSPIIYLILQMIVSLIVLIGHHFSEQSIYQFVFSFSGQNLIKNLSLWLDYDLFTLSSENRINYHC